jgi:sporulation protein YlmC with PRC-barrel domain
MARTLCGIGGALFSIAALLTPVEQASAQTATVGKLDPKTSGSSVRASQLMGANIQNPQGEGVGEVNDIVVDAATGRVQYAAVTYGGAFGIGNKMFAVPWEAFKCVQDPDDANEYYLVLNVTQKTLDGAQGFDEDNWPNFADQAFRSELDKRYGVKRATVNVDVK